MVRLKVNINDELLQEISARLASLNTAKSMPATAKAMKDVAKYVQNVWKNYAIGRQTLPDVPPMKIPSRWYAEGIGIKPNGPFDYEVVNPSDIADYLENGTSEIDMKKTHTTGPRSRVSKKGVPYLIVPFRWGTPKTVGFQNVMPVEIYDIVKKANFEKSIVGQDTHNEPNFKGEDVDRWNYDKWGSRLKINQIIEADDGGMNINQMFNMSGMVRMDASTKDKKYSGYYTFRVISANGRPDSWIKPATPARHITDGVVRYTDEKGEIKDMLDAAFRKDLGV
jgi:hypothetical protein